ncbi:MAG: cysteine--tRNA ligase [Nanoarchaeota archaeon]|nr:cysteine--tRNA ligase [Nanoarchaeota archaeon]
MKLYNTLSRKKEKFVPLKKGKVGMYSCGPTVYWYQHIGNLRSYIFSDVLKRVLLYDGFDVKQVMNVTDVGHLTSDADEGEDKIEKAATKEGKKASDIANYYLKLFQEDFKKLNIINPDVWPKATEHIKEQIELIKILEKKGYTYETSDGIYFDTSKFKDYGKMAKLNIDELQEGKRVDMKEKKNKTDFALWKFSENPGERQQEWNPKDYGVDWKIGFPGWHIECSAMSSKYLGEQFDIHTGGEDHIPIHHTNEIAQSEAAFGKKPWVKYWLHGYFLTFGGKKVSKSEGGLYTISELEEKGYSALDYRYLVLTSHYRTQMEFSLENLDGAKNAYQRIKNLIGSLDKEGEVNSKYIKEFEKAIDDDLDMPKAMSVLWNLVRDEKAEGKIKTIEKMDEVFGLDLLKKEKVSVPADIKKLVDEREKARKEKDWEKADKLRDELKEKGWVVEDGDGGGKVKKIEKR